MKKRPFENIVGKGENDGNAPFPKMFCTLSETSIIPEATFVICKYFQFGQVENFDIW